MKSAAKLLWICLLVFGLSFMPLSSAASQTYTATVTGTVSDPQGAAVPGVRVVATNQGTKLEYTAQTSEAGVYTIPFLPIGVYVLTVESTGFKKLVSNEIKLEVNQTARVDLQLQVGAVNEIVNVQGVAPVLQTENVMVGQVISGSTTTNLPLNGRNFQQLALLLPGAVTPNPNGFNSVSLQNGQGRPYVNGQREQGKSVIKPLHRFFLIVEKESPDFFAPEHHGCNDRDSRRSDEPMVAQAETGKERDGRHIEEKIPQ